MAHHLDLLRSNSEVTRFRVALTLGFRMEWNAMPVYCLLRLPYSALFRLIRPPYSALFEFWRGVGFAAKNRMQFSIPYPT